METNKTSSDSNSTELDDDDSLGVCLNGGVCSTLSSESWVSCNSPRGFELTQLWSAMENVTMLCSSCNASFTLTRGQVMMFRVPEPLRVGVGLRLTLQSAEKVTGGVTPSVYVSEVLPRSLYDFTYISLASDDPSTKSQAVDIPNSSFSGDFWVVVHTDYPSTNGTTQLTVASSTSARRRRLRGNDVSSFQLVAEQYETSDADSSSSLLTDQSFGRAIFSWVFRSPAGIAVFTFAVTLLVIALCFCVYRVARAPENQDKVLARLYPPISGRGGRPTPGSAKRATGAVVMDINDFNEQPQCSKETIEHRSDTSILEG
ncbi:uncharacterized protein PITG_08775 [Phytophthora infestans T30-4]|uniref:Transmembrane protein n=1 Tax=Phytophthora infestans (strain T30-4) TaxID=403677 RepID=D0ND68_PHYIT|nr:uncharacterized protein PITG_08775 [Phytophthora infestans T30-4]EEY56025.1 hypothetical protein PITG_08775 [Phytophthora infestans T30-4]|eukprot:XP_002902855.1 hypothetical protein PITG_08775 [Phytophthora infestans T30-4]